MPPSIVFLVRTFGVSASLAKPGIRHVSSSGNVWGFFTEETEVLGVDDEAYLEYRKAPSFEVILVGQA